LDLALFSSLACLSVQGPLSRRLLSPLVTCGALERLNEFPFSTMRELTVAGVPGVRVLRLTFVGELGFELHMLAAHAPDVYAAILERADVLSAGTGARWSTRATVPSTLCRPRRTSATGAHHLSSSVFRLRVLPYCLTCAAFSSSVAPPRMYLSSVTSRHCEQACGPLQRGDATRGGNWLHGAA